jgi:glycosyltransferase involved in cell wall biosynthesis
MKIGIFTSDFPYKEPFIDESTEGGRWGGVGEVVYQWALGLNALGHEVKIFTVSSNSKDQMYRHENIEVFRYGRTFQIAETGISLRLLWKPIQHDLDVANAHRGVPLGALSAYIYTIFKKVPLVLSVHGPYSSKESYQGSSVAKKISMVLFRKLIYGIILSKARIITALSTQCVDEDEHLPKYRSKIEIIPNGIHLSEYDVRYSKEECRRSLKLPLEDPIILYLSSLIARKGPQILIKSIPDILKRHPNTKIIFVGDGKIRNNLEEFSENLGIKNSIIFSGFISEYKKNYYYRSADIFCLPSFAEGYPMVLLEASAFGLPSVVSDIKPHQAIIRDKYNGLFFKSGDHEDLAHKMNLLLTDNELRETLGHNAWISIYDQTWDNIVKKVESVLISLDK